MNEFEALKKYLDAGSGYSRGYRNMAWQGDVDQIDGIDGEFKVVDRTEGDHGRWTQVISVVIQTPSGRLYRYEYEEGLTEYQEDDYDGNLVEVLPHVQTITVTEYKAVA